MKVKELLEQLGKVDPEALVLFQEEDSGYIEEVDFNVEDFYVKEHWVEHPMFPRLTFDKSNIPTEIKGILL